MEPHGPDSVRRDVAACLSLSRTYKNLSSHPGIVRMFEAGSICTHAAPTLRRCRETERSDSLVSEGVRIGPQVSRELRKHETT
jgi:hypothetical protein